MTHETKGFWQLFHHRFYFLSIIASFGNNTTPENEWDYFIKMRATGPAGFKEISSKLKNGCK